MARRRYGEVTSGSGKSHQGRRITMAQPVSSILGDVVKSSRSIAHSDDFEGHKLIQTNSRQLILLDLNILYWCPASRDQIKPLLVQPQISCNASGLAAAWSRKQQASSRWAAAEQQVSSRWAATGKQQQAAASSRQVAGKQQGSSRQAAGKQRPLKEWSNIFFKNQRNKKNELFPGARPQNNEIVQLLKVVVMPNLNFFQAHGLPIRLLQADTT